MKADNVATITGLSQCTVIWKSRASKFLPSENKNIINLMIKPKPVKNGLLFLMRVTLIHILISSFTIAMAHAVPGFGQEVLDRKVSIDVEGAKVQNVLLMISRQANVKFAYSPQLVEDAKEVTLHLQEARLGDALDNLLGAAIEYKVLGNQIVLMPVGKTSSAEASASEEVKPVAVTITGKVTDEFGSPLPGVNVVVKGTSTGVTTDADGMYTLEVSSGDVTLVFSFIGYATKEVAANNQSTVDVTLQEDIQSLAEVVVVGYGTQEKKEVTAAISQVSGEEIKKSSAVSISNSLAGRVPGLFVNQTNSEPGRDDARIFIRGVGTTGNTDALIVVDGIANRDGISRIDPNDIETITVLKDASAAIYGAQAANGVVLITTKRGKTGKPTVNYSFNQGFVSPTRKVKLADAGLYARSVNTWNGSPLFSAQQIADYESGVAPSTDWIDEVYKGYSLQNRHSITLNGGTDKVKYFLSTGTTYQNGLITGDETTKFKQYNVRSNIDAQISERFKIGLNLAGRREDRRWLQYEDETIYGNTIRAAPTIPATINGLPTAGRSETNPLAVAQGPGYLNLQRNVLNGTLSGEYKIPYIEGLSVDGFAAIDIVQDFQKKFYQPFTYYKEENGEIVAVKGGPTLNNTYLKQDYIGTQSVTLHGKIKYERTFGMHNVNAFVAYEQNEFSNNNFYAQRFQYQSSRIDQLFAGSANTDYQGTYGSASETARQNYFGRVAYTLKDRYMLQFHFRYDGSSNFPSDKRFGFFPGVSAGWRISEEAFMIDNSVVSNLKLRASWGKLGNDRIDPFQYLSTFSYPTAGSQGYVLGGNDVNVLNPGVAANPNITWETKRTFDVGFDAGFFANRLTWEFDVFFEKRNDILAPRNVTVPNYTGLVLPDENIGEVDNKGFDTQIMYRNTIGDVNFNIGGNITYARNKVIFMDEGNVYPEDYQKAEGHPIGSRLAYQYIGVYRTQADLDQYPGLNGVAVLGDPIYRDVNGDGAVTNADRTRQNLTNIPQLQYGITLGANYKGFDFSAVFQGQARAEQYLRYSFSNGNNGMVYFLENAYDTEDNPNGSLPAINRGNTDAQYSTLWLQNVSFVRLKNIELGYTIPNDLVSRVGLQHVRVYVNGYNLLTFDKLKKDGLPDPENTNVEGWQFPHTKSINFGLNLTF